MGDVYNVVDDEPFDARVTHYWKINSKADNNVERVRIASINAPEIPSLAGFRAKRHLETKPLGTHVKLSIQSRDIFGRPACDVALAAKSTLLTP